MAGGAHPLPRFEKEVRSGAEEEVGRRGEWWLCFLALLSSTLHLLLSFLSAFLNSGRRKHWPGKGGSTCLHFQELLDEPWHPPCCWGDETFQSSILPPTRASQVIPGSPQIGCQIALPCCCPSPWCSFQCLPFSHPGQEPRSSLSSSMNLSDLLLKSVKRITIPASCGSEFHRISMHWERNCFTFFWPVSLGDPKF